MIGAACSPGSTQHAPPSAQSVESARFSAENGVADRRQRGAGPRAGPTQRAVITCAAVVRPTAVLLALVYATGRLAHANPAGFVPTAGFPGIGAEIHVTADAEYDVDTAQITREEVGDPDTDQLGPIPKHRDLQFRQVRQLVTPR